MDSHSHHRHHVNTQKAPLRASESEVLPSKGAQAYAAMAQKAYQSNMGSKHYSNLGSTFDAYDDQEHARPHYAHAPQESSAFRGAVPETQAQAAYTQGAMPQGTMPAQEERAAPPESADPQVFDGSFNAQFARSSKSIQDAKIEEASESIVAPQSAMQSHYKATYENPVYESSDVQAVSPTPQRDYAQAASASLESMAHQEQAGAPAAPSAPQEPSVVGANTASLKSSAQQLREPSPVPAPESAITHESLASSSSPAEPAVNESAQSPESSAGDNLPSSKEWSDFMNRLSQYPNEHEAPQANANTNAQPGAGQAQEQLPSGQEWSDFMQRLSQHPNMQNQDNLSAEHNYSDTKYYQKQGSQSGSDNGVGMQHSQVPRSASQGLKQWAGAPLGSGAGAGALNGGPGGLGGSGGQGGSGGMGGASWGNSQPNGTIVMSMPVAKDKFSESLGFHILMVAVISLLLLIPSMFFEYVLDDRQYTESDAIESIIEPWGEEQVVSDPLLVVPGMKLKEHINRINGESESYQTLDEHNFLLIANNANSSTTLSLEKRARGNYEATLYKATIEQKGTYDLASGMHNIDSLSGTKLKDSFGVHLYFPILYKGAIDEIIAININGKDFEAEPSQFGSGFMVYIDSDDVFKIASGQALGASNPQGENGPALYNSFNAAKAKEAAQSMNLVRPNEIVYYAKYVVRGSQLFAYMPVAQQSFAYVAGEGTVPSFTGRFLPSEHEIDDKALSFNATYRQSSIATGRPMILEADNFSLERSESYQLSIADRSMSYTLIERLTKYVLLFISMTFVTVLAFEIVSRRMVSLVQYVVIGVALVLFYMVLLSLNEHISFTLSYIIAALLMSSMIALYLKAVLASMRSALCIFLLLLAMYAVLFAIVHIQSYALLVGTFLLVIMLAVVMFITRRLNDRNADSLFKPSAP